MHIHLFCFVSFLFIFLPTFVFFVGLTPPSFPFQFRTAQVGVSMSKECNTCVFFWHYHSISHLLQSLVIVTPTHSYYVAGFLIIYHHN